MYQHHIQLKTPEKLSSEDAINWFKSVDEFGPENIVYNRQQGDHFVAVEYGLCQDCEFPHTYLISLARDITSEEARFVLVAWEYMYDGDFDIELSSGFESGMLSTGIEQNIISIDEEVRTQAISEMQKWRHNRWYQQKMTEGWRHGAYYNSTEKTHPALKDWDNLTESHRRSNEYTDMEILEWLKKSQVIK
ncbi:RyR domain-containing protein [bacterium]|nr:RyR domain-containing protein [bacterium]MDB4128448.1 RyR domain-containing protein [bacterium]MDC1257159.1 RyR domain-containing protein [bacterium]